MVLAVGVAGVGNVVRADELLSPRRHVWLLRPKGVQGASAEGRVDDDNRSADNTGNSNLAPCRKEIRI